MEKEIIISKITSGIVNTQNGPKTKYDIWVDGEEMPYGTWNKPFCDELNKCIGQPIKVAYDMKGVYKNLIVPDKFKSQGGFGGSGGGMIQELKSINEKLNIIIGFMTAKQ